MRSSASVVSSPTVDCFLSPWSSSSMRLLKRPLHGSPLLNGGSFEGTCHTTRCAASRDLPRHPGDEEGDETKQRREGHAAGTAVDRAPEACSDGTKSRAAPEEPPSTLQHASARSQDAPVRDKVLLGETRARLTVTLSNNQVHACVVNNRLQRTYAYASSFDPALRVEIGSTHRKRSGIPRPHGGTMKAARAVGRLVAQRALRQGIKKVFFDRKSYRYVGRVKALADGAREGGLDF
ncbi:putative LSU ribosomal protein L18P [Besnoitia besnoiti]|uniref:Putative LSU ribosomal protein L18P n=1 Tax=Besnoitia besnoiti TaxID=94643 RepID=A0A2A9MK88_BESBE|nr:putative LSU ribosomal protein L18P [Besnoitia besnoiti]PFH35840.1 putative LSU ribosomal protein L18P [Besnoitia besnoiti]